MQRKKWIEVAMKRGMFLFYFFTSFWSFFLARMDQCKEIQLGTAWYVTWPKTLFQFFSFYIIFLILLTFSLNYWIAICHKLHIGIIGIYYNYLPSKTYPLLFLVELFTNNIKIRKIFANFWYKFCKDTFD